MADEEVLSKAGIHIDEMNRIRLLNPEISDTLNDLRTEGRSFAAQMTSFRSTTEGLIKAFEEVMKLGRPTFPSELLPKVLLCGWMFLLVVICRSEDDVLLYKNLCRVYWLMLISVEYQQLNKEKLANLVEAEKLRAMAARAALQSVDKAKSVDSRQLQIQIRERQVELERLRVELASLQDVEQEQKDILQQLIHG